MVVVCSIPWLWIVKNGQKCPCSWEWESTKEWCHSHQIFSNSFDLKSLSFKLGIMRITFEMPRIAYNRPFWKIYISLLFRPSVIRGPWVNLETLYISLPSHYARTKSPRLSQDHLIPQLPTAVHPQMNCWWRENSP